MDGRTDSTSSLRDHVGLVIWGAAGRGRSAALPSPALSVPHCGRFAAISRLEKRAKRAVFTPSSAMSNSAREVVGLQQSGTVSLRRLHRNPNPHSCARFGVKVSVWLVRNAAARVSLLCVRCTFLVPSHSQAGHPPRARERIMPGARSDANAREPRSSAHLISGRR